LLPEPPHGPPLPVKPATLAVYTPVLPALLHDDHCEQSDVDSDMYELTAVGVAEQADFMHDETDAPASPDAQYCVGAGQALPELQAEERQDC
jgi:hypothetical protein